MDLLDLEMEIAELDNVYRPLVTKPAPEAEVGDSARLVARISKVLRDLGVHERAATALRTALDAYQHGDEEARSTVRRILGYYRAFSGATRLSQEWATAEEFRLHLVHLSARDLGPDPHTEILTLDALCSRAAQLGIDIAPLAQSVAAISSDLDRHGVGSMRAIMLHYGQPAA